jgi:hypothetical protein
VFPMRNPEYRDTCSCWSLYKVFPARSLYRSYCWMSLASVQRRSGSVKIPGQKSECGYGSAVGTGCACEFRSQGICIGGLLGWESRAEAVASSIFSFLHCCDFLRMRSVGTRDYSLKIRAMSMGRLFVTEEFGVVGVCQSSYSGSMKPYELHAWRNYCAAECFCVYAQSTKLLKTPGPRQSME